MIIVDTNVFSELVRAQPNERVIAWFGAQDIGDLWTTAITEAELLICLAMMPQGRRRAELESAIGAVLVRFEHRILSFDRDAARDLPVIFLARRAAKLEPKLADSQIAAIALAYGAVVATRDTDDFAQTGIQIVDPWIV